MEYKDPGYFLLVSTPHGVGEEQMKVRLSSEFNARKHPDAPFRASMEAFWEERLQEPGITLFDASKYRVHSSVLRIEKSAEEETHDVELRLGVTSYKEFITTNAHPKWFTLIEEEEQFNFYEAMRTELAGEALMGGRFLSHPAGVSVALVTSDGKIPLLLRSGKVAEIKDCLAFPGGHAEPERALLSAESLIEAERRFLEGDAEVLSTLERASRRELFYSVNEELVDEIGVSREDLQEPLFVGISVRFQHRRPTLFFVTHTRLSSVDVQKRYEEGRHAEDFESVSLHFVPLSERMREMGLNLPPCHLGGMELFERYAAALSRK